MKIKELIAFIIVALLIVTLELLSTSQVNLKLLTVSRINLVEMILDGIMIGLQTST
jgi:hypothetical protein